RAGPLGVELVEQQRTAREAVADERGLTLDPVRARDELPVPRRAGPVERAAALLEPFAHEVVVVGEREDRRGGRVEHAHRDALALEGVDELEEGVGDLRAEARHRPRDVEAQHDVAVGEDARAFLDRDRLGDDARRGEQPETDDDGASRAPRPVAAHPRAQVVRGPQVLGVRDGGPARAAARGEPPREEHEHEEPRGRPRDPPEGQDGRGGRHHCWITRLARYSEWLGLAAEVRAKDGQDRFLRVFARGPSWTRAASEAVKVSAGTPVRALVYSRMT